MLLRRSTILKSSPLIDLNNRHSSFTIDNEESPILANNFKTHNGSTSKHQKKRKQGYMLRESQTISDLNTDLKRDSSLSDVSFTKQRKTRKIKQNVEYNPEDNSNEQSSKKIPRKKRIRHTENYPLENLEDVFENNENTIRTTSKKAKKVRLPSLLPPVENILQEKKSSKAERKCVSSEDSTTEEIKPKRKSKRKKKINSKMQIDDAANVHEEKQSDSSTSTYNKENESTCQSTDNETTVKPIKKMKKKKIKLEEIENEATNGKQLATVQPENIVNNFEKVIDDGLEESDKREFAKYPTTTKFPPDDGKNSVKRLSKKDTFGKINLNASLNSVEQTNINIPRKETSIKENSVENKSFDQKTSVSRNTTNHDSLEESDNIPYKEISIKKTSTIADNLKSKSSDQRNSLKRQCKKKIISLDPLEESSRTKLYKECPVIESAAENTFENKSDDQRSLEKKLSKTSTVKPNSVEKSNQIAPYQENSIKESSSTEDAFGNKVTHQKSSAKKQSKWIITSLSSQEESNTMELYKENPIREIVTADNTTENKSADQINSTRRQSKRSSISFNFMEDSNVIKSFKDSSVNNSLIEDIANKTANRKNSVKQQSKRNKSASPNIMKKSKKITPYKENPEDNLGNKSVGQKILAKSQSKRNTMNTRFNFPEISNKIKSFRENSSNEEAIFGETMEDNNHSTKKQSTITFEITSSPDNDSVFTNSSEDNETTELPKRMGKSKPTLVNTPKRNYYPQRFSSNKTNSPLRSNEKRIRSSPNKSTSNEQKNFFDFKYHDPKTNKGSEILDHLNITQQKVSFKKSSGDHRRSTGSNEENKERYITFRRRCGTVEKSSNGKDSSEGPTKLFTTVSRDTFDLAETYCNIVEKMNIISQSKKQDTPDSITNKHLHSKNNESDVFKLVSNTPTSDLEFMMLDAGPSMLLSDSFSNQTIGTGKLTRDSTFIKHDVTNEYAKPRKSFRKKWFEDGKSPPFGVSPNASRDSLSQLKPNANTPWQHKKDTSLLKKVLTSEKGKAEKQVKKSVRTKMPNFDKIHQRQFEKMENIKEMQERRAIRAQYLLSGTKPSIINNATGNKLEKDSKRKLQFTPAKSPFKAGVVSKQKKSLEKKKTKSKLPVRIVANNTERSKTDVGQKILSKNGLKVSAREAQIKAVATKTKVQKDIRENTRKEIKGFRSNRRFDLLMKMRQNLK